MEARARLDVAPCGRVVAGSLLEQKLEPIVGTESEEI